MGNQIVPYYYLGIKGPEFKQSFIATFSILGLTSRISCKFFPCYFPANRKYLFFFLLVQYSSVLRITIAKKEVSAVLGIYEKYSIFYIVNLSN